MVYQLPNQKEYEATIYALMHMSLDQLIDIGAKLEAHSDILATHDIDEDGNMEKLPDVHPEELLKAQVSLDGAEEEAEATQSLVKDLSRILIVRRARDIIQHP
jgi:hypothetical protein